MDAADYAPEGIQTMPDGPGLPITGIQRGTLKDADGDPSTYLYPSSSMTNMLSLIGSYYIVHTSITDIKIRKLIMKNLLILDSTCNKKSQSINYDINMDEIKNTRNRNNRAGL